MNDYERNEKAAAARRALKAAVHRQAPVDTRVIEAMKRYLTAEEYHELAKKARASGDNDTPHDS